MGFDRLRVVRAAESSSGKFASQPSPQGRGWPRDAGTGEGHVAGRVPQGVTCHSSLFLRRQIHPAQEVLKAGGVLKAR